MDLPLRFRPTYMPIVWGGRRMAQWRADLPAGPIGESWDLADHQRGMSVVADGPLAGVSLRELTATRGGELVGGDFAGGDFPLMVKLIDANDRLSIQVHPDDALARQLGVGPRGKTECWLLVANGGELYVGLAPGVDRAGFERAIAEGRVASQLNRFDARDGDFYFLGARTVHALGRGCLLYEVQQTCDVTFRVDDWGRVGLDGKPRELHVAQSLATIDFTAPSAGPVAAREAVHPAGGSVRRLASCDHFTVEERHCRHTSGGGDGTCAIVIALAGAGRLGTAAGAVRLEPMTTWLVPAAAGAWSATADDLSALRLLVAQPVLSR
ncbi:MAG TPA: type I phosphomannose isomerase catalytic subunit [Planctomycetota bacterium]|nr:type I phosphomannose isomerase catalytic subunit [Planctomycetota bacterium]